MFNSCFKNVGFSFLRLSGTMCKLLSEQNDEKFREIAIHKEKIYEAKVRINEKVVTSYKNFALLKMYFVVATKSIYYYSLCSACITKRLQKRK